jgi:hypothetical protein
MHHLSPTAFGAEATAAVLLRQSRTRSPRRAATDAADDSFIDSISCRLIAPTHVSVEETLTEHLAVVKVGFTLALPPGVALEWVRLRVQIALAGDSGGRKGSFRIVSLYPTRVATNTIARGRIAVGANGELIREEASPHETEDNTPTCQPNVLGWKLSTSEAVWDWLPATKAPPLGSDALFLTATYPMCTRLQCTRSVRLAVRAQNRMDAIVLEHDAEAAELAELGPA